MVQIRDRRLGLIHYLFLLVIFLYIVGWNVIYEKRYLLMENIQGSVRLSIQKPPNPIAPNQLPYCYSQSQQSYNGFPNYPCQYWDENLVQFPMSGETALFATTRATISNGTLDCDWSDPSCGFTFGNSSNIFVGDIEHFTVMFDHAMIAIDLGIQNNAQSLSGKLLRSNGSVFELPPNGTNSVGQPNQLDILEIEIFLEAAGISSLDTLLGANNTLTAVESMRYGGIILMVVIEYSNTETFNPNTITYEVSVHQINNSEFKAVQNIYRSYPDQLVQYDRHGIRLLFIQAGQLGRFDFPTLLLSLVAGLGLLTATTLAVDYLACYFLPQKSIYYKYKFDESIDFSDLRDGLITPEEDPAIAYKFKIKEKREEIRKSKRASQASARSDEEQPLLGGSQNMINVINDSPSPAELLCNECRKNLIASLQLCRSCQNKFNH